MWKNVADFFKKLNTGFVRHALIAKNDADIHIFTQMLQRFSGVVGGKYFVIEPE
jgi:hypothetical protein